MKKSIKSAHPFDKPYEDLETGKHQGKMWRGVPGVEMIWHGEWSDPELEYEGTRRNYWDVEDAMYEWAKEDGIDTENDEEFNRYCQEHAYDVYECFSSCGKKNGKKPVKSSRKPIQSMARGYLQPQYDSRASFYNKAEFDDDKLYSYGTLVAEIVDGKPVLYPDWDYSQTTLRHVREFLRQHGFTADSKAQIAKDYLTNSRRPIQSMYVTQDISGNDLYTCLWSGGKDQFDSMIEDGADADDILNACEELLFREEGNPPTMTELNDLIWFEPDTIRDYIGLSNPIESGCHGKSKKKDKKKVVKSGRKPVKSSRYNPYNGKGSFLVSIDIVEQGEHDTVSFSEKVLPLEEFISECKSYAESTNGYYTVTENGENQYKIEFGTSDDSFADEPGTDPYYEESCGVVIVELIYPFDEEMADYIENGGY